jgi:hypothetical protein
MLAEAGPVGITTLVSCHNGAERNQHTPGQICRSVDYGPGGVVISRPLGPSYARGSVLVQCDPSPAWSQAVSRLCTSGLVPASRGAAGLPHRLPSPALAGPT